MHYVYTDEAGTSDPEQVSVVVGIVVASAERKEAAERAVRGAHSTVPPHYRDNFVFHASSIRNDKKYREQWSRDDRTQLLHTMMVIPSVVGLTIAWAAVRRSTLAPSPNPMVSKAHQHHVMAFLACIAEADRYVRTSAGLDQRATIIAENAPKMYALLSNGLKAMIAKPLVLKNNSGVEVVELKIERMEDKITFEPKHASPIMQIADACAFGLRRFFEGQSEGDEFATSILSPMIDLATYRNAIGSIFGGALPFEPMTFGTKAAPCSPR